MDGVTHIQLPIEEYVRLSQVDQAAHHLCWLLFDLAGNGRPKGKPQFINFVVDNDETKAILGAALGEFHACASQPREDWFLMDAIGQA